MLHTKKKNILELWMKNQLADPALRDELISNEELRSQSEELVEALIPKLSSELLIDIYADEWDDVIEIMSGISISQARKGYSARETFNFLFSLKKGLIEVVSIEFKHDFEALYNESQKINEVVDRLSAVTFETFLIGREEVILRQAHEIDDIATPVVRVWDGILALPIIGTLDSSRTEVAMEKLLDEIVKSGSSVAILDISGVPAVDTLVAQHLIKTVSATRLMGAECIISGIRPEIAQTIVHLGIDLSDVITKSTLAGALSVALRIMRLEVKKISTFPKL